MPLPRDRADALRFVHLALGTWLGVYAFRSFVATAVWNLADAWPLASKGALAIGIHALGVIGCILPLSRSRKSLVLLAALLALTGTLRQAFIASDAIGSAFSLGGWVFWLWWLAAFARRTSTDTAPMTAGAIATGLSLQVGMQGAWHGLDLPLARGAVAVGCALAVNALFAASAIAADQGSEQRDTQADRSLIALGVVLFLELTLLANVGRVGALTGLGLLPAAVLIQAGLALGALLTAARSKNAQLVAGVLLLIATFVVVRVHGAPAAAVLLVAQVAAITLLAGSSARRVRSAAGAFTLGAVLLFLFVFLFYSWYELAILWSIAAMALVLCALPVSGTQRARRFAAVAPITGVILSLFSALPPAARQRAAAAQPLRLLTYNIHQGYDAYGTPGMQAIADEIAAQNADVVALQEVGRGWTFVGGADLVAYLRYRFPDYRMHFVPVNGQLWGVALLSRLPLDSMTGAPFSAPAHAFRYGYAAGTLRVGGQAVRVVSVHLTAGLEGNGADGRVDQIDQLLRVVAADNDVIVAGDLNTHPDEPPLRHLVAAGFTDGGAEVGIGAIDTWPANRPNERIDYVWVRGRVRAVAGSVKRTNASDHLPVAIELDVK